MFKRKSLRDINHDKYLAIKRKLLRSNKEATYHKLLKENSYGVIKKQHIINY